MRKVISILAIVTLAATLLPAVFAQQPSQPSSIPGQTQASPSSAQQQPSTPPSGSAEERSPSSFTGTVVQAGGKYVLQTANGTYQLDDQDKAKQFEGKDVKVNGTLDKSTSMIHVSDITPASQH